MSDLCGAARNGDEQGAREINDRLMELHKKLFVESNPIPVKWALEEMDLIDSGIRLPLTPLSPAFHEAVRGAMRSAGVIG
jgi:4-hydroxy-tetrahydrodipicolinate synthase